jgi:predicted NodU family carbamoyl transferase
MIILGLNAFHADSSAALVQDGKLIAAAEEERFRRIKHWAGFPSQAIAYCLSEAGIKLSDIDHIAFNQDSRANLMRKITYFITKRPNINLVLRRLRNRRSRAGSPHFLSKRSPAKLSARRSIQLNIISRTSPRHFMFARLIRRPSFRLTASATSRVQPGELRRETTSRLTAVCTFHIRSAYSTRPLRNTLVFRIMAMNTR